MDGENNGKPYEQMDDLGVPLFLETSIYTYILLANIYANARVWMLRSLCYKYCTNLPKKGYLPILSLIVTLVSVLRWVR